MFDNEALAKHIMQVTDQYVSGEEVPNAPPDPNAKPVERKDIGSGKDVEPQWIPIDLYQHGQRKQYDESRKSRPKGSPAVVKAVVMSIISGNGGEGLGRAYKRYKGDIDEMLARGEKERAALLQQQYMQERFLPAIEAAIEYASPDELLNCKEALAELDKLAMGVGKMSGYTAAYVRQAYEKLLGQKQGSSDPTVDSEIRRIRNLVDADQMRTAIGMATKLKQQIDNGEHAASDEDYALLGRMVSYAN